MKSILSLLPIALFCCAAPLAVHAAEPEFIRLFEGEHAGQWKLCGRQKITLLNGVVDTASPESQEVAVLWYSGKKFGNFTLRVEFKRKAVGWHHNSGVYFRIEDPGDDPKNAYRSGYSIEMNEPSDTGSVVNFNAPRTAAVEKAGDWNEMVLTVISPRVSVAINHQVVNEYEIAASPTGYIALENWEGGPGVQFRNLRVKELPATLWTAREPATMEEALLSHEWQCHIEGAGQGQGFKTWFLPDGKVKQTKPHENGLDWEAAGPNSFMLRIRDKTGSFTFPEAGFRRFEGTDVDGATRYSGERGNPIPPPAKITASAQKKNGPEVFTFVPAVSPPAVVPPPSTSRP